MRKIQPPNQPPPAGHYSPAVVSNGFAFLSGVLPVNRESAFAVQTNEVFENCKEILSASGCVLSDVVQCTAYIVGVENWDEFNRIYANIFGHHKPARTVVPVTELHYGALVEIQLIAKLAES